MKELLSSIWLRTVDEYIIKCKPEINTSPFSFPQKDILHILKDQLIKHISENMRMLSDSIIIQQESMNLKIFFTGDATLGDCFRMITYDKLINMIKKHKNEPFAFFALNISDKFESGFFPQEWREYKSPYEISFSSKLNRGRPIVKFWEQRGNQFQEENVSFFIKEFDGLSYNGYKANLFLIAYYNKLR